MALIEKLSAIGDAIREKTGKADKLTLDQMPVEIASIVSGGGGGFSNIEVVTIATSFTLANGALPVFSAMVANGETTYFVRKTKDIPSGACMFACFNLPVTAGATSGYTRWRSANGFSAVSTWTSTYELVANAGDEYYKVVIS